MDSGKKYHNPSPELQSNIVSRTFYCWVLPFLKYGYKRDLEVKDIYNATEDDSSGRLGDELEKKWLEEIQKAKKNDRKPSLKTAIFNTFYKSYMSYGFQLFFQTVILRSIQPIALAEYIAYFEDTHQATYDIAWMTLSRSQAGWLLGLVVVSLSFLTFWTFHYSMLGGQRIGMRVRIASCSLLYRKMLKLSQSSLGETAAGQLVNLMSNDVQRFDMAGMWLNFAWITPVQFIVACYIMFDSIGVATVTGMLAIGVQALLVQNYLSRLQGKLRFKIAQRTDYRVKVMSEIVSGIQVIKMYAWEKPFEKVVELARKLEIKYVQKTSYIKGFSIALMVFTERFTLYLTLVTFVLIDKNNHLTSQVVFSMAQLLNTVQLYMCLFFPMALASYAEAKVTVKRLEGFLLLEENQPAKKEYNEKDEDDRGLIRIKNASASWLPNPVVNTLINVNLTIPPGSLCCVVGNVGSGKSSLLQMLLRELPLKTGSVQAYGAISYASQEPWLFVSSIRNNILFGKPYLKEKYNEIVKVCALEKDMQQFPYGDKTPVGERGVSLSGGQKARINLARAVYNEADIYLLDDPLSAVDTHVGKHLFEQCLKAFLKGKTRILSTHQLQFLKEADIIVVVNNGRIENIGTYNELSETALEIIKKEPENDNNNTEVIKVDKTEEFESIEYKSGSAGAIDGEPKETEELIEKGSISTSVYMEYHKAGANIFLLILMAILFIAAQMSSNACDLWVTHWTNSETNSQNSITPATMISTTDRPLSSTPSILPLNISISGVHGNSTAATLIDKISTEPTFIEESAKCYIIIYSLFILSSVILTSSRSLLFFKVCMNASKALHNKMFNHVLKAPMRFFDTNPSGRILNRFSKDIGAIDELLPRSYLEAIQIFLVMGGIISMVLLVTPYMIVPTILLGGLFNYFRNVYLSTAQDVKRIEGVTRAPVFSHLSATLYGLTTVRSSNAQDMVAREFDDLQDQHTGTWFLFIVCSEAFGFYLDVISTLFLGFVTLQFLIFDTEQTLGGNVGLVISSSMILSGMLQLGVRQSTEVASHMTSVERVLQYTKLNQEEELNPTPKNVPDRNWPHAGKISFKNTYLRYAPDEPPVLKNMNIVIEPGEKVGIVGRTGAGKSTLIASLFRLAPIEGTIAVDDVDTATVSLDILRSNISIIPQEPILFSSTIRYNLDPFNKANDDDLWRALENVELKNAIDNLDQKVNEGGSNFSAGQRQLMCLARAILRNNKVLVMDEATANVDPQTDGLIQKSIRKNFKDCTVLTIAHRLNTIMDSDKVLVMESGEAVEYGHPHELLQKPDGYFTKMVDKTGNDMAEKLKEIARESCQN